MLAHAHSATAYLTHEARRWIERLRSSSQVHTTQSSVGPMLAILMVATSWLLPNHTRPWLGFHSDAWMAVTLALLAVVALSRTRRLSLSWVDVVLAFAALLPLFHHALGLVPFAGQAWTSTAYVLGLLLAVMVGRTWHEQSPMRMGHILFGAFCLASVVSVGMQLHQWTGQTEGRGIYDIWIMGMAQDRPYANLGQPNQLATLLLWGMVGCGWAFVHGQMRPAAATLVVAWLLLGLVLTQSRTGLLGLSAMSAACWYWRSMWPDRRLGWFALAMVPAYALMLLMTTWLSSFLMLENEFTAIGRTVSELRPALWHMVLDAVAQRPWLGYGWNELLSAQLAVAERRPLPTLFAHAHNLPLDLIVWTGVPMGLALTAAGLWWTWLAFRRIVSASDVLYLLVVVLLGIHAMLELPHHYASFLLPAGLAVGALTRSLRIGVQASPTRSAWAAACALLAGAVLLLGLIIDDYFKVEASMRDVRLKLARIQMDEVPPPPQVRVLTQFRTILQISLMEPVTNAGDDRLQRAHDVATSVISYRNLSQMPVLLALNGHVPEARCWMGKAGLLVAPDNRPYLIGDWQQVQRQFPQLQGIEWTPIEETAQLCEPVKGSRFGPYRQPGW